MMSFFEEKYFGYIASSYAITLMVTAGMIVWILLQHRAYRVKLSRLEEQGLTRRSSSIHSKG